MNQLMIIIADNKLEILTRDANKGIALIQYDLLGHPTRVQFTNGNVTQYVYAADGRKLRTKQATAVEGLTVALGQTHELTEDETMDVEKKVKSMFTDPDHLRVSDPGKVEGNTVFTYLDAFCREEHFGRYLPDYPNLDELKAHYRRGGLGDMKVKKFLAAVLQETLEPIRQRRAELEKDIPAVIDILRRGTEVAREAGAQTMSEVRRAMRLDYFDDASFTAEQAAKFNQ